MPCCVFRNCKNYGTKINKIGGVTYHTFPRDELTRLSWVRTVRAERRENNWLPTKSSTICSDHFKNPDLYSTWKGYVRLNKSAVPSLPSDYVLPAMPTSCDHDPAAAKAYSSRATHSRAAPTRNSSTDSNLNSDDDVFDAEASMFEKKPAAAKKKGKGTKPHTASSSKHLLPTGDCGGQLHEGFQCKVCRQNISGYRYTCVQCADYDMCCACEAAGAHAAHYVLRVPGPRPYSEVRDVVERIRQELVGVLGVVPPVGEDEEPSIKVEVKSELDPEPDPLLADSSHAAAAPPAVTETITSDVATPRRWTILDEAMGEIKVEVESEEESPDPPVRSPKRPAPRDDPPPKRMHIEIDSGFIVKAEPLRAPEGGGTGAGRAGNTGQFAVFSHKNIKPGASRKVTKNIQIKKPVPIKIELSAKRKNK